jgi:hypothetical protein
MGSPATLIAEFPNMLYDVIVGESLRLAVALEGAVINTLRVGAPWISSGLAGLRGVAQDLLGDGTLWILIGLATAVGSIISDLPGESLCEFCDIPISKMLSVDKCS